MPKEKKKRRGLKALLIVLGVLAVIVIAFAVFITGGKNSTLAPEHRQRGHEQGARTGCALAVIRRCGGARRWR